MAANDCKYAWPAAGDRRLIGTRISRIDGPDKSSGRAKYSYDVNRPGMLFAAILRGPYPHAKITALDTAAAERFPGVRAVHVIQGVGTEIQWEGDEIVALAADSEDIANDALRQIKIEYQQLPFLVQDEDLSRAGSYAKPGSSETVGDPAKAFADPHAVVVEGFYGLPIVVHCCLEAHGSVAEWTAPQELQVWMSTQGVSTIPGQMAEALNVPAANIRCICQYLGGGFGSKFAPDRWGIETARLAQAAQRPVKYFLDRGAELEVAGCRPSAYAKVRVAATPEGALTAWESQSWATGGLTGGGSPPLPYIFSIPNQSKQHTEVATNQGGARAWRAPEHPQACLVTLAALDDLAAKLRMDPIQFLIKNIALTGGRSQSYIDELKIASDLAEWNQYWHPRGDSGSGPVKRGLGVSLHTWGGRGHASNCQVTIEPDGSVAVNIGSQDLGTGTRTVIGVVAAETLGLPLAGVTVHIGDSRYPKDGPSGGSTTVGGVSASTRRAAVDALGQLFAVLAPRWGAPADQLQAVNGRIQVKGDASKSVSWRQACAQLGVNGVQAIGKNPGPCDLISSGVAGVQIADVSVDVETGVVTMNRMVAVQDCGLIIDLKTAESQVYGAMIMGIGYSLFEERVMDATVGRMLNANMEFYKLAGIGDIGELVVHMMTGPGYDERGPIGLGEPPTVSPGAAISNAVANAIGVRVPTLPIRPDKVLAALASA